MKYNASQLLVDHLGATREIELDEPPYEIDDGIKAVAPLRGLVRLSHTNRGILADARLKTQLHQECSRCLEDIATPLDVRFIEEFYPTVDLRTGKPMERPDGGAGFMLNEAHELDLTEPVRQSVLLEVPMKPLCRPDCAGLCPQCGQNFNQGTCSCADEQSDPRLAALADWLKAERLH